MFTYLGLENIDRFYEWYKEGYPVFFRHFDDFMNREQFCQSVLGSSRKCLYIDDIGIIILSIQSKVKSCEVSILINHNQQKNGVCFETMKNIADYLFKAGIIKIIVQVSKDDERTNGLCLEGGFVKEAEFEDSCFYEGKLHNEIRYILDEPEYRRLYG